MAALFAATYPSRTVSLIMYGSYARRQRTQDYPWGQSEEDFDNSLREIEEGWGGPVGRAARAPSAAHDEGFMRFWSSYLVQSASPHAAMALTRMNAEIDVRPILSAIQVPTLILHREGDRIVRTEEARYLAEHIPTAKLVVLPGEDHLPWVGDQDAVLDEIEEGLTGIKRGPTPDRVLATVLFTDIVDSTKTAAALGDTRWKELLRSHDDRVRAELARFRGVEVKTTGDGFLATFDGPARAVRCAVSLVGAMARLGIEIRAGLHTGEIELDADDVAGMAVAIGARVGRHGGSLRSARLTDGEGPSHRLGSHLRERRRT
jgi:class 3 adenylate cyclase